MLEWSFFYEREKSRQMGEIVGAIRFKIRNFTHFYKIEKYKKS